MEDGGWRMEDGGWRMEDGGWRMEDGGWRMEDGGWRMGDGGWGREDGGRTEGGGWRMEDGGWRMEDGGWRMEDGGWRMEDGGWRMEDGGWRMEDGGWRMGQCGRASNSRSHALRGNERPDAPRRRDNRSIARATRQRIATTSICAPACGQPVDSKCNRSRRTRSVRTGVPTQSAGTRGRTDVPGLLPNAHCLHVNCHSTRTILARKLLFAGARAGHAGVNRQAAAGL